MSKDINKISKMQNGLITYSELLSNNFNKANIRNLVLNGTIKRVARGLYYHHDYTVDMMLVSQTQNSTIVFSHETAAYLHNLTDRFPRKYSLTVNQGTNIRNREDFNVFYVSTENHDLGKTYVKNNFDNLIVTYDIERTVCDMIRSKERIELQVYLEVLKNYFNGKTNMNKLTKYAKHFNVANEVYEASLLLQQS
jgi:predicted transcriptional regulator of viral defense system